MHYLFNVAFRMTPRRELVGATAQVPCADRPVLQIAQQVPLAAPFLDIGEAVEHARMVAAAIVDKRGDIPGLPSVLVVSDREQTIAASDAPVHELVYVATCDSAVLADRCAALVERNGALVKDVARNLHAFQQLTASSAIERSTLLGLLAEAAEHLASVPVLPVPGALVSEASVSGTGASRTVGSETDAARYLIQRIRAVLPAGDTFPAAGEGRYRDERISERGSYACCTQ